MAPDPREQRLLEALERFLSFVVLEAPFAEAGVRNAWEELTRLVAAEGDLAARDEWVGGLLGMYGGMGSVNDFPWSEGAEAAKEELYARLVDARSLYHARAGGEHHDPASFPTLEVGERVRLVEGRTYHVDTSGKQFTVDPEVFPVADVWTVTRAYGPDITGTPTYGLSFRNRHVQARVSALEVVSDAR